MRRYFLILTIIMVMLALFGCNFNSEDPQDPVNEEQQNEDVNHQDETSAQEEINEQDEQTEKQLDESEETTYEGGLITTVGGLGDSLDELINSYGENQGNEQFAIFQDDFAFALIDQGRAVVFDLDFEQTIMQRVHIDEAKSRLSEIIPQDAVEIRRVEDDNVDGWYSSTVILFESQLLAAALEVIWLEDDVPGRFIVTINEDDIGVFSIQTSIGNM